MENGPLDESNRECRDVFCCLIFVANIIGMIYCTIHAYTKGDTDKIYRGIDGQGNICGDPDSPAADYPYVYFYNPQEVYQYRYCVKECPVWDGTAVPTIPIYNELTDAEETSAWDHTIDD